MATLRDACSPDFQRVITALWRVEALPTPPGETHTNEHKGTES